MKKIMIAALVLASLLIANCAFAEALPGTREAEAAVAVEAAPIVPVDEEAAAPVVDAKIETTREYRWFVNKYHRTYGQTVEYYDNVYAYNHGEYYLTPFSNKVPAEYFVMDDSGTLAVAPIVLDITDAMRTALYGADVGETYMLYGQYCERVKAVYHRWGFSGVHEGIDFVNEEGAPLYAILGGVVTRAGDDNNTVAVYNEEYDCTLVYLHGRKLQVKIGDEIEAGTLIAYEGDKKAGSPYTHVEFRLGRQKTSNRYTNPTVESDCPYETMRIALNVAESGRQPVTAAAVLKAQQMREAAEAAARAEAEAAAAAEAEAAEPEIELVDTLPGAEAGYGFEEEAAEVSAEAAAAPAPEATLPPTL